MNTTWIASGRSSNSMRTRRGRPWRTTAAIFALALCLGISPLAAQTVTGFTRVTRRVAASDPNSTTSTDPNATAHDPNQTVAADPNGTVAIDPNQTMAMDPNQTMAVDPNAAVAVDPNQMTATDPNQAVVVEPNQVDWGTYGGQFNKSGNILIADRLNHRVIEVDRDTDEIVWQFGDGSSMAGPTSVVAPSDAERVGEWTLICGGAVAASTDPNAQKGPGDHRVFLVDRSGKIFWQYGQAGVAGSDVNQLDEPACATYLFYGHILICDQGNHRVIEVSLVTKTIVWQHGTTGTSGTGPDQLCSPSSAQLLDNGNILIADAGNNRVIEVDRRHRTVWQYGDSNSDEPLNGPSFACRLEDGNTLITDSGHNRILETDHSGHKVMEFATSKQPGSVADPLATRAVRLDNGDTLICDQFNHQVIEIDADSNVVFTHGSIGAAGNDSDRLNCPCDAKVIGDYTGLTPPCLDSYYDSSDDSEPPPDQGRYERGRHEHDRHDRARERISRR
jgi:uncharacterized protein (UPF0248 family)